MRTMPMDVNELRAALTGYIEARRLGGIMESTLSLDRRKVESFLDWLDNQDLTTVKHTPTMGVSEQVLREGDKEMSETTTEGTESPEVRAFYPTDYKRFAAIVRTARRDHGDEVADTLASPITAALSADFDGFDAERFLAGTYQIPAYVPALASALKTATHVKCQPWTAAPEAKLSKVATLATALTETLDTLVPHFTAATFMDSVKPPQPKQAVTTAGSVDKYAGEGYDDSDDDPDEY